MADFSLKLEVHLAMPIRDIMNAFILGNDSFLCLYNAGHNSRKWVTSSFSVPQHLHSGDSTHPIWTSLSSTVSSVKKGNIKARLLTGTYLLEIIKHKFSSGKESPLCKCCLRFLIIGKANVLSIISLTMADISLKLEVHLAMPIRDIMTWLLQKKLNCRVSVGTATLDHT
jgi:hypothetical protein